jgi:hypothetical protein
MKKSLYVVLLNIGILGVLPNTVYTAQKNPETQLTQKKPHEEQKSCSNIVRRLGSWIFRDELTTTLPDIIAELAPHQKAISNASELLTLLTELKNAISKEEISDFLKKITRKPVKNKTKNQPIIPITDIDGLLETNKNNANKTIVYILDNAHTLSQDACTLGKKLLIPLDLDNEESIDQELTQELITNKITCLEKFKQEKLVHVGEIVIKSKNIPLLKPIVKLLANKLIFIPLKITLVIVGTAALIQIGALGTSYFIPSLREAFPNLTRVDYCLTPLYKIGSFLSSFFQSHTMQAIPCKAKDIINTVEKIVEKPLELYKNCEEMVNNSVLQLTPKHKIFYIKECIKKFANDDTRKIIEMYTH